MKSSNSNFYELKIRYIFFAIVFSILFTSCNNDKEITPNYVGNWELISGNVRSVMILSQNSFQTSGFYNVNDENEYMYATASGDLIVTTDSLKFKVNNVKTDTAFYDAFIPSGELIEFNRGTVEFDEKFGETADYSNKYEVNGDKLKLWIESYIVEYDRVP